MLVNPGIAVSDNCYLTASTLIGKPQVATWNVSIMSSPQVPVVWNYISCEWRMPVSCTN